ncbi:hypothetical protein BKA65DRAFT_483261 [Rhexocercosporidium sp. MPI-PUGE-AT-0058]|nr:hypothetical protein BKA65DRAFT_483261 [Rhexocercosporidium sp. MPI-PUGE-AT-0058]
MFSQHPRATPATSESPPPTQPAELEEEDSEEPKDSNYSEESDESDDSEFEESGYDGSVLIYDPWASLESDSDDSDDLDDSSESQHDTRRPWVLGEFFDFSGSDILVVQPRSQPTLPPQSGLGDIGEGEWCADCGRYYPADPAEQSSDEDEKEEPYHLEDDQLIMFILNVPSVISWFMFEAIMVLGELTLVMIVLELLGC